jgi:cytochrome c-type biogenesis protein CcmH/NrfG
LHSAGRYREAVPCFQKVIGKRPGDARIWLLLGLDDLNNQPEESQKALANVLRLDPDNKPALLASADASLRLHRP